LGVEAAVTGAARSGQAAATAGVCATSSRWRISATMITQIVDEAEARGLVERRPNPADRRSYLVTLRPEGERLLAEGRRVAAVVAEEIAEPLGPDGDRELRALLRKLTGV
jgi:DNA-binding MarR family transcriptional regulator